MPSTIRPSESAKSFGLKVAPSFILPKSVGSICFGSSSKLISGTIAIFSGTKVSIPEEPPPDSGSTPISSGLSSWRG